MSPALPRLENLLTAYRKAPAKYQATSYWRSYEERTLDAIRTLDIHELRSGKHPIFSTFGFSDAEYIPHPNSGALSKALLTLFIRLMKGRSYLPYGLKVRDIQEAAFRHCELLGRLTGTPSPRALETSDFGGPADLFQIDGRRYTMAFLNYYVRQCFAHQHIGFTGKEIVVELGPGSGYQTEILKKLYPDITVLCFDMPGQIYLCETYLTQALGQKSVIGADITLDWKDLSMLERGKTHFFGNWQMPLLHNLSFNVFWNAASFGEMEPEVVENYLSHVKGNAEYVYLLQARHGKETQGRSRVSRPITFDDYDRMLSGYSLLKEQDAWFVHSRLSHSGGYFEAVWKNT